MTRLNLPSFPGRSPIDPDGFLGLLTDAAMTGRGLDSLLGGKVTNGDCLKVDIRNDEHQIVMFADVPGIPRDDVEITCQDDIITIAVREEVEREEDRADYYRKERRVRGSQRSFQFNEPIDSSAIHASLRDGVLAVTLPKIRPESVKIAID